MLGCCQAAVEQFLMEARRREHDHDLRDVGSDQLLALDVGAIKKGSARRD
jgi:hypothetical protein